MADHIAKAKEFLRSQPFDALIISNFRNRRYISGFSGSAGLLLLLPDKVVLLTDFRYVEQAKQEAPGCEIVQHGSRIYEDAANFLARCSSIAYEENYVTVETFKKLQTSIPDKEWLPTNLDLLRTVKDQEELSLLKNAVDIADRAFARLLPELRTGMAEIEAAALLEFYLRQEGASGTSFPTIVASGERSSLPHGQPTDKVFAAGDFVTFDFGAVYKGYCSDITRTVVIGKASEEQKKVYGIVLAAQLKALAALKPGITGKEGDAAARDVITAAGYGQYFGHGTGHSVGLAIHEEPRLSPSCAALLEPGMVVTVEPGIYIPGWGGVRIEDMVAVTGDGVRILTATPKQLLELG